MLEEGSGGVRIILYKRHANRLIMCSHNTSSIVCNNVWVTYLAGVCVYSSVFLISPHQSCDTITGQQYEPNQTRQYPQLQQTCARYQIHHTTEIQNFLEQVWGHKRLEWNHDVNERWGLSNLLVTLACEDVQYGASQLGVVKFSWTSIFAA